MVTRFEEHHGPEPVVAGEKVERARLALEAVVAAEIDVVDEAPAGPEQAVGRAVDPGQVVDVLEDVVRVDEVERRVEREVLEGVLLDLEPGGIEEVPAALAPRDLVEGRPVARDALVDEAEDAGGPLVDPDRGDALDRDHAGAPRAQEGVGRADVVAGPDLERPLAREVAGEGADHVEGVAVVCVELLVRRAVVRVAAAVTPHAPLQPHHGADLLGLVHQDLSRNLVGAEQDHGRRGYQSRRPAGSLIEIFSAAPGEENALDCLGKLIAFRQERRREADRAAYQKPGS